MIEPGAGDGGRAASRDPLRTAVLWVAAVGLAVLAAAAAYQLSFYVRLPVDLLSFAESPFITDIIKLRVGEPLYTPPADHNSYPYTPGTQLLTYGIASLFGRGDSIPFLRAVQLTYLVAATAVGAGIVHYLCTLFFGPAYRQRLVWGVIAGGLLFLVAFDPRFNLYTHSLHNDGLGLLVSALAYGILVRDAVRPRGWHVAASCLIPVLGFLVKQSLLIWLPLAAAYYLLSGRLGWRRTLLFGVAGAAAAAAVVAVCRVLWGEAFMWWVFGALGAKSVAPWRSALHLLEAGAYVALGLVAAWVLLRDRPSRTRAALWGVWLVLILGEGYTSGVAWVSNHLGPGVFLATCWALAAAAAVWAGEVTPRPGWPGRARAVALAALVLCLPGALGVLRVPQDQVPADLGRYVAAIEAEFAGLPADEVLLDNGSWIYLREGVPMKDRSSPLALHVAANQPEVSREPIQAALERIKERRYRKILTRELDSERFPYDFQYRGSGVREAIRSAYREAGRIPAVEGVERWWPKNLLSEMVVLVPRDDESVGTTDSDASREPRANPQP
ncbi:MAG: hypothetical protein ACRELC_03070 [Gemmatimonadota bacterium]